MLQTTISYPIRKRPTSLSSKKENCSDSISSPSFISPCRTSSRLASRNKVIPAFSKSSSDEFSDSEKTSSQTDIWSPRHKLNTPSSRSARKCTKRLFYLDDNDSEESPSPPKVEKRTVAVSSPQTPSQLISKLRIESPAVQKSVAENALPKSRSPKKSVAENALPKSRSPKKSVAENAPPKSLSPKKLFDKGPNYQDVRQALHSTVPEEMPGREEQLAKLQSFLKSHLESKSSATLYISGPPGTGKTACLSKIMLQPTYKKGFKTVYVNCTTMKSAISIYCRICEELDLKPSGKTAKDYLNSILKHLSNCKKMILLVLDEIDQLDSKNQSVLYTIFEWPSQSNSKLVLVGIANALDLTDRILPRLQARLELQPELMHFPPYSKDEIIGILSGRLKESDPSQLFTPVAMRLVAAKVASVSGDARRALDIACRVVEMADNRVMPLKPTTDHVSNTSSPKKNNASTINLQEVMSVLNNVYGASQTLDEDCDDGFPLQQKVVLCTLILVISKGKLKEVTIGKLHDVYRRICAKRNLQPSCQSEFLSLCSLIETRGIIGIASKKEARMSKVCLQWDEKEVSDVLRDKQLLASILKDTECLTK